MTRRRTLLRIRLLALLTVGTLAGCGQTGPLTLPDTARPTPIRVVDSPRVQDGAYNAEVGSLSPSKGIAHEL